MKKNLIFSLLFVFLLTTGVFWVESTLSLADDECYCRDHSDMLDRCEERCVIRNSTCAGIIAHQMGDCVDLTCWTYFNYLCDDGHMGIYLSNYNNCIDCYDEP